MKQKLVHDVSMTLCCPVIPRERHEQGPHITMVTGYINSPHAHMIEVCQVVHGQALYPGTRLFSDLLVSCPVWSENIGMRLGN